MKTLPIYTTWKDWFPCCTYSSDEQGTFERPLLVDGDVPAFNVHQFEVIDVFGSLSEWYSRSSDTQYSWSCDFHGQTSSEPCADWCIAVVSFLCQSVRKVWDESSTFFTHSSIGTEDQQCKGSLLYFKHSLEVLSLLRFLVGSEDCRCCFVLLASGVDMRDADIKNAVFINIELKFT